MACPSCGAQNEAGKRFCTNCGAAIPVAGNAVPPGGSQSASASGGGQRPQTTSTVSGPAQRRGRGCLGTIGCALLALLVLLVVVGGGGYFAFRSGLITTNTILNLVGRGPGDIELDNFRDDTLNVSITQVEVTDNSTPTPSSRQIKPFDISKYRAQNPGRYRVEFRATSGPAALGACTLTVRSGDKYQFVALPDKVVVNLTNHPASVGTDFILQTSSLCR